MGTDKHRTTIHFAICTRYEALCRDGRWKRIHSRQTRMMDLAHLTVPMDWDALLAASDTDFIHDVAGIHAHIYRVTGELTDCFLPRFAHKKKEKENVD